MTNEMPNLMDPSPEPGAPDSRRRNITIAVVVAVVLVCCCCCALLVGVYLWQNGDDLMQQFGRLLPTLSALA